MSKSDNKVLDDREDAEMMRRDHLWPQLFLPLTRSGSRGPETALLLNPAQDGEPWVLMEGANLWGGIKGRPVEYESPEAIVAAGWMVD